MEIFGNGLLIGMGVPIRTVVRGVIRARAVWFVVVAGATARTTSGRRTAATTARRAAPTISVFAFTRPFNPNLFIYSSFKKTPEPKFPLNSEIFFLKEDFFPCFAWRNFS